MFNDIRSKNKSYSNWKSIAGIWILTSVFFAISNGANAQILETEIVPSDPDLFEQFGNSVAIGSKRGVIGGPNAIVDIPFDNDAVPGERIGAIIIFDAQLPNVSATVAMPIQDVESEGDQFGCEVAVNGTNILVTAKQEDSQGFAAGIAILIDGTDIFNISSQLIFPDDIEAGDTFGEAAAITDQHLIVSSGFDDNEVGNNAGAVYIFAVDDGTQIRKILPPEPLTRFGRAVAADGDFVLVGVPDFNDGSGAAFLFRASTGEFLHRFDAPAIANAFGLSMAIDGNIALIGAPFTGGTAVEGAVFVYDLSTKQLLNEFLPPAPSETRFLGESVDVHQGVGIVNAFGFDGNALDSGGAYLFNVYTGEVLETLFASDGEGDDDFGRSVAIDGTTAVVGATGARALGVNSANEPALNNSGTGYVYRGLPSVAQLLFGDVNLDGIVDLLDISPFVDLLSNGGFQSEADINNDGTVNLLDVAPFVDLLASN